MTALMLVLGIALAVAPGNAPGKAPVNGPRPGEEIVEDIVAWVNDDIITLSELRDLEQQQLQAMIQSRKLSPEELSQLADQVRKQALLRLIDNRLLVEEAERLYNMDEIRKDLVKRFMKRNEIRTDEELEKFLEPYGMTREDLADRLVMSAAPDYVVDMQVRRTLSVTEEEARKYYEEHGDRWRTPGSVTFREIVLEAKTPAERERRRKEAEKIVAEARQEGSDFGKLVQQYSEAASKAVLGRIGPIDPRDLRPEIARVLLAMKPGEVSDPVETADGWHVLLLEDRVDEKVAPFEEVRRECEDAVRAEKFAPKFDEYITGLWKAATIEVRRAYADRLPPPWNRYVTLRD